ncbi:mitochondrial inner membrane protein OXA1L-like [Physella acuta]|uniref:mitochondrial inner membrane protein OXA1L-like n=1 Tax=Physella acuta TaxID=109671 RepID=UPI0027DE618F|nr:mitochondrial inner membrane protein OXA1L-like [Physella acuta]
MAACMQLMNQCCILRQFRSSSNLLKVGLKCIHPAKKHNVSDVLCASLHTGRHLPKLRCVVSRSSLKHHIRAAPVSVGCFRLNSSATSNTSQSTEPSSFINPPTDYIPPVPPLPDSATSELVETLNALGEPTLQSVGLGGLLPPGLVQQGLELLHAGLGLPWWGSIVVGTIIVRTCMFPIVVKAQKMSINMMNHMPTVQRLQLKFTQARQRGNMVEALRYGSELGDYMKRNNVKPFGQMLMPLCQVPIFLSVFIGLRGMANLPVESMKTGGCLWFPDLTITGPLYGLPLLTAATFWLTVEAGVDGLSAQSQTHVMKWFLRAMPVIMLPLIANFPSAMLVYWFTSNGFSLIQVLFLKIPRVRLFFNIPKRVEQPIDLTQKKGFLEGFKEAYSNMKASQQVMERQRLEDLSYRKAAQGPIVKTYPYNPKTAVPKSDSFGDKAMKKD